MSRVAALPQVILEANGTPLSPADTLALGRVRVQQRLSMPAQCELTFYDPPGPLTAASTLAPGTSLRVAVRGKVEPLFVGEVTAVEHIYQPAHGRELTVRAYDRLHRLRKRQNVRVHVQITPENLARELVADVGLDVQAAASGPSWQRLYQHHQSDLALLVEMTEQCGLYFTVREDTLHLLTLDGLGDSLVLTLGESLFEARVELNGDPACRSVTATGWDPLRVETHSGRASGARSGREVSAEVNPGEVGGDGQRELVDEGVATADQAEALAQAELDRRLAGEVTLWGIAEGDPALRPATRIEVKGLDHTLTGRYVLTEVVHVIDERAGFVSELSTAPPPPRRRPRGAISTLGVVTQVNDDQDLGRIRVSLPAYGDVETDWMGVLSPGAGRDKGLVTLPDVGDHVLVLLSHEDPGQGIILGGLYGMEGPPDSGVENGEVRRYTLRTPGGQLVQLDDTGTIVRLENAAGSYVELAPGKVRVHAATDLEIEAPGHAIVIRGQAIDFQRG
ncbi:MAG: phage baseplate assembly protein V [Chloroflexi bacterium]|nr:phage baseplate assembly protein V [Chloroflexota bacterium]MCI0580781.1 phage baseplate assembly protein V [Chloroflexota bacterium]MCI0648696.1 phage baseplate assembly protein V [Chloroflexota bacterium]MCI0731507.1 phage baseplate assembly protein V [Chloroflexota bacterium]